MKLKYYMRGLGIGMVVTAFILSVVIDKDTKTMSDDEILARARELGMVESTVLSQMAGQNKPDKNESDNKESETSSPETEETQPKPDETQSEPDETQPEPEVSSESDNIPESESSSETEVEPEGSTESEQVITIVIYPGENSETVCRSMEEAGLVENAREMDRYLCDNGYDNRISIGTYEIPADATMEEIAKIITKSR